MNIFASSADPATAAQNLDDQRLVKMVLESCQLLSTAAAALGVWREGFARPTHASHPCVVWVMCGRENFDWLWDHVWELDLERRRRFGSVNVHKTLDACHQASIQATRLWLPAGGTPHVNCARNRVLGVDFTHVADTHLAYRLYLKARWSLQKKPAVCTLKGMYVNGKTWRN
jgi:hypothetical protein